MYDTMYHADGLDWLLLKIGLSIRLLVIDAKCIG